MKRRAPQDLRPEWMADALCATVYPDLWHPHDQGDPGHAAKKICRRCPVIEECLEYALANRERHGIWGGLNARERDALRNPRRGP